MTAAGLGIIGVWWVSRLITGDTGSMNPVGLYAECSTMATIVILFVYFLTMLSLPVFMWRRHRDSFSPLRPVVSGPDPPVRSTLPARAARPLQRLPVHRPRARGGGAPAATATRRRRRPPCGAPGRPAPAAARGPGRAAAACAAGSEPNGLVAQPLGRAKASSGVRRTSRMLGNAGRQSGSCGRAAPRARSSWY